MKEKKQIITFAFAADPHVESSRTRDWLIDDLTRIKDVDFIVMGGDLTWSGSLEELDWYKTAIDKSPIPVYSVFGGHDGNELRFSNAPDATANFRKVLGNPWYAFDAGHARAICTIPPLDFLTPGELDYLKPQQWEEQERWLQQEIDRLPDEQPLLMFQHMPTTRRWPDFLDRHSPLAVFMGHWHLLKVWQQKGTIYAAVPPIAVAGYSGFPRGYYRCTLTGRDLQLRFITLDEKQDTKIFPGQSIDEGDTIQSQAVEESHLGGKKMKVFWALDTGGFYFKNSPIYSNGQVYVVNVHQDMQHSSLRSIKAQTGKVSWEKKITSAVYNTPVLSGDRLLVMKVDGTLQAFNPGSGSLVWSVAVNANHNRWAIDGFTTDSARAYLRTTEHVVAIRLEDGKIEWQKPFQHHDWVGPSGKPLIAGNRLFVPAVLGDGVICLDSNTGDVHWRTQDNNWFERMSGGLALDQGILFCIAFGIKGVDQPKVTEEGRKGFTYGGLIALDAKTGDVLWNQLISSHNYSHPVVTDNLVLVSDTVTGRLQAYKKISGEEVWSFSSGPPQQCVSGNRRKMPGIAAAPVIRGEDVYVGAADCYLYQLNLSTGKLKARSNLGSAIHATPVLTDQRIVVPTSSGVLYGIVLAEETLVG